MERPAHPEQDCAYQTRATKPRPQGAFEIALSADAASVYVAGYYLLYLNPDLDVARTAWAFLSQFRLPAE